MWRRARRSGFAGVAFAQSPDEPQSLPDEYGGEVVLCENPVADVFIGPEHIYHECADDHTHSWWNRPQEPIFAYPRPHVHTRRVVDAEGVNYVPVEIRPSKKLHIDAPVRSGPRRCDEPAVRGSYKREEAWDMLNCEVRRSVEMIVAATIGVGLFGFAWGGIHIISSSDGQARARGRQVLWASIVGIVVAMCCYIFAGLVDLGVNFHVPWGIQPR